MKGLATFQCAAVFLAAAAAALLVSGADIVSTAVPPPVSADTERCVHLAVPPLAGKDFIKVSMSFNASPSNSLAIAFGADADGDGRLSLREQAAGLGWDNGVWFVRRPGASAWERLEEAGAAGPRLLEAVLWLRSATSGPRLVLSVDGTPAASGARAAGWVPLSALENGTVRVTARGHGVEGAGRVAFAGGSTGPEVAVTATSTGAFRLEADIKGLVITPPHVRPFFTGTVLPAVNVPVTVWIVRDGNGENPARDAAEIPGLLTDANKILWQNGLTLVQSGTVHYADNAAWLNPSTTTPTDLQNLDALLDCSSGTGGVELYFVRTITGGNRNLNGIKRDKGIAIAAIGDASTIAHEVLHACGLVDIYPQITVLPQEDKVSIPDVCAPEMLPSDWCGGYYEPGLMQKFVVARLIMSPGGYGNVPLPRADIPSGNVWGYRTFSTMGDPSGELELRNVGLSGCHQNPVSE